MKKPSLSLIIFAFNEASIIEKSLNEYCTFFNKFDLDLEIIFIDDGSSDNTFKIAENLKAKYTFLKCFKNENNLGIGKTIKKGIEISKSDYLTYLPGDCAFNLNSLTEAMGCFFEFEFIICSRINKKERKFKRFFLSHLLTLILNIIFRKNLSDYNAFVIAKKKILREITIFEDQTINWTMVLQLLWKEFHHKEIPVKMKIPEPGNNSTAINLKSFFINFLGLIKVVKLKWKK